MKKVIAFIIILVANLVLLLHAVIPHYHLEHQVSLVDNYVSNSLEQLNEPNHHHHDHSSKHHHENEEKKSTNCHLNQPLVLTFQQSRSISDAIYLPTKWFQNIDIEFINNVNFEVFISYTIIRIIETPKFLYTSLNRILLKLRAPPEA